MRARARRLAATGAVIAALSVAATGTGLNSVPQGRSAGGLRVGVARIDITPDRPLALEGYLDPEQRISAGVHDRLYARAIALSSGPRRLVLVSADLASFAFGPHLQRLIGERVGLQAEDILLCATHTHSGPLLSLNPDYPHPGNAAYTASLTERLVDVIGRALQTMAPARMAVGRSTSRVGVSRRSILPDGRVEMAPNPSGVADPEVLVLRFERQQGELVAVLFSYACHSRSLRSSNRLISGDVLGVAEQHVERHLGGSVLAAAFAGASGDVDPERVVDGFGGPEGHVPDTERLGQSLGDSVLEALTASTQVPSTTFDVTTADIPLEGRNGPAIRRVRVLTAAIGDVGLVATECEVSAEVGLAVKAASPFKHTFVATVCHGWGGYLPATRQYREGGYEVDRSPYAPGAAERLVESAVGMLRRLSRTP